MCKLPGQMPTLLLAPLLSCVLYSPDPVPLCLLHAHLLRPPPSCLPGTVCENLRGPWGREVMRVSSLSRQAGARAVVGAGPSEGSSFRNSSCVHWEGIVAQGDQV